MNSSHDRRIQSLLKSSLPPIGDAELPRDLWPDMLRRIEAGARRKTTFSLLDWVITGMVAASVLIFPGLTLGLLYHL